MTSSVLDAVSAIGPGVTAWESLRVIEELAYHDGATGWCAMIGSTTSLLSSYLPDDYAKEIFGNPDTVAGGFAALNGLATPTDDGLLVSGTWQWGSGGRHRTWMGGGCRIVDGDGRTAPRTDGSPCRSCSCRPTRSSSSTTGRCRA